MITVLEQFALALFATLGFSVIFRVPVRHIPVCIVVGAMGWISYLVAVYYFDSTVLGTFLGACMVGLLSTLASYIFKDASTIFVIPGILCLVPGAKIFYTMDALMKHQMELAAKTGVQMLMLAGAIAMGLLVMYACTNTVRALINKTVTLKDKF